MSQPTAALTRRALVGVGLTSAALMATEITLTRVLSVTVWYHFAFFAISVALLGSSLSALVVHVLQRRLLRGSIGVTSSAFALCQAGATLAVAWALSRVRPDWFGGLLGAFTLFTWKLLLVFSLTMLPFVGGGFVLALATARYAGQVHRVYFADLVGAAVGCVVTIPLVAWLGGPRALASCACIAALAAAALLLVDAVEASKPVWRLHLGLALAVLGVTVLVINSDALALRAAKGVDLTRVKPEITLWNSFSLVSVFDAPGARSWGLSPRYQGSVPEQKSLLIDMNALTSITRFDGDLGKVGYVLADMSALVYRLMPAPRHVCVIGAGGGKDVLSALAAGAGHVTGVEINPLIVDDVMLGRYRDFSGRLYERPDVDVHVEDGRSFMRRATQRFDVILISMVDTSAATAAGAYALTENGLYTTQAFDEFLARLQPGGVLTVSTVSLPGLAVGARLAAIARQAVLARGGDPARAVAVAHTPWMARPDAVLYDVMIKPDGFSDAQAATLQHSLTELGFEPGFVPGHTLAPRAAEDGFVQELLTDRDERRLSATLASWPLDVSAVHDDRPFFFYQNRFADFVRALSPSTTTTHLFGNGLSVLAKVLALALGMLALCSVLPLVWLRRAQLGHAHGLGADLAYVCSLGVGFMCVEIALVHRVTIFLGQPTYTLVAVLFVLLLAGGLGSRLLSARFAVTQSAWWLVVIAALVAALPALIDLVFGLAAGATLPWRALVVTLLIAPLGALLGAALPAGLARAARAESARVAWLWGVNGAASVLGSILATLISLHAGTRSALLAGAALYLLAALVWTLAGSRAARQDRANATQS
ncbi:MAG TPA: hypothetical protein VF331_23625 [Polyangiales bacterium]